MEPDWGMWADTSIHDAILIVTERRDRVAALAARIATGGHFVLVCPGASVPEVLALAYFELVVILDDVPATDRQAVIGAVNALARPPCPVIDDGLARMAPPIDDLAELEVRAA